MLLLVAVVVVVIVASHACHAAFAQRIWEQNLTASIEPHLHILLKAQKRMQQSIICISPASVTTQIPPEDQPGDLCLGTDSSEFLSKLRAVSDLESAWPAGGGKESWP